MKLKMDMDFKALLRKPGVKPALIIGNGVNLYNTAERTSNWLQLLLLINTQKYALSDHQVVTKLV